MSLYTTIVGRWSIVGMHGRFRWAKYIWEDIKGVIWVYVILRFCKGHALGSMHPSQSPKSRRPAKITVSSGYS
jgi:hypothetical protein